MDIEQASRRIREAINNKSTRLHLGGFTDPTKLKSNDLEKLLPEIKKINNLNWLYLDHNALTDISFLKGLKGLTSIYLRHNKISDISPLKDLTNLDDLHLFGNHLLKDKIRFSIDNPNNPKAIIREYLDWDEAKKNNTLTLLNEAKIVLVGQGNVGKSSLRISLKEGKCIERQKKTEGLEVVEWDLAIDANRTIKFNIWDFGGQEIYHTTHQYFFTSECLYILVTDYSGRVEWRTNRVSYWLSTIQMIAKEENNNSKPVVIIVGNKSDEKGNYKSSQETIENEIEKLKEKFNELDIIGFFPVSCYEGDNIHHPIEPNNECLVDVIKDQHSKIGADRQISQKYVDYKEEIIKSGKDFIKVNEFSDFCPLHTESMRIIFNSIGIITSFCDNHKIKSEKLRNLIVINSEWITNGIYKILSANHILETNNGIATRDELRGLLDENKYPFLDDIIEMMREYYICRVKLMDDFEGNQVEKFFFPKFYSNKTPAFVHSYKINNLETQLIYRYDYSFISDNIIAFFIIKADIKFEITNFWKDGAYIAEDEAQAIIEADNEENSITVIAKGGNAESLLTQIKNIFNDIHRMDFIPKPKNQALIPLNIDTKFNKEQFRVENRLQEISDRIEKLEREKIIIMNQQFNNKDTQVVSQGNQNEVHDNTLNYQNNIHQIDFHRLNDELRELKEILMQKASTVEEGIAIGKVDKAIEASQDKDESKVIKSLKEGGKFVLDTAKEITAEVLSEIIKKQIDGL